jgi:transcriptional regulator
MYVPAHFAEHNLATLHDAIERYSFATLVSGEQNQLTANHLPLLLDRTLGPSGTLLGHMARANVQWHEAADREMLAIFSGPHAYVSPTWYQAPQTVPTWNYVAVHAYGRLEIIANQAQTEALLQRTIEIYEASQPKPWRLAESADYVERLLRQIVGFRIPISRLEGKWKLNQNRPPIERERVIAKLSGQRDDNSREIARLIGGAS